MASDTYYDGSHSLIFGLADEENSRFITYYHTWEQWHLIPSSKLVVAMPGFSEKHTEIPGRHGILDLSTYLTGSVTYGQRTGSWSFLIDNGHRNWEELRSLIAMELHGKEMDVMLTDDPNFYWNGRFSVSGYEPGANNSELTIDYSLYPYKRGISKTLLADHVTLSGERIYYVQVGEIANIYSYRVSSGTVTLKLNGGSGLTRSADGHWHKLGVGKVNEPNASDEIRLTGNGNVTVGYREARL